MNAAPDSGSMQEAAAWVMRLKEGIGSEEEIALELWLDAHPGNRGALASVSRAWRSAGETADLPELIAARADALKAMQDANRRRWRDRSFVRRAAMLAACLVLAFGAMLYLLPRGETYRTGIGERRVIALADGSRLSLDASSAVEVRYDRERRELRLLGGRARFDVAKDPRRPFTVSAGNRMVVATGTAFSVELVHAEMRVVLYEGSVAVLEDGPAEQAPHHVALSDDRHSPADHALSPGTALTVATGSSTYARVERVDPVRSLSWEQGQLIFSDEPLGVAVERINRYSPTRIEIDDPRTAALPISGAFNAGDTDGFVDGVSTLYGLRKSRRDDTIMLGPER